MPGEEAQKETGENDREGSTERDWDRRCMEMDEWDKRLIAYRRLFHRYPETGWLTFFAACFLAEHLRDAGYEVFAGEEVLGREPLMDAPDEETVRIHEKRALELAKKEGLRDAAYWIARMKHRPGIVARLDTGREGDVRAYRFDIDALTVQESGDAGRIPAREHFCSAYPGIFHACGHDGHAAIGLAFAEWLAAAAKRGESDGTHIFIFQPAEEGARGAIPMCENWCFGRIDRLLCCHIGFAPEDTFVAGAGGFLATTKFDVEFHGKSAHAGLAPERGKNALLAAAEAVVKMQEIARPREGLTRLNVGVLEAGEARNTIPAHAKMRMETRGGTTELNAYMKNAALRCIDEAAKKYGVRFTTELKGECVSTESDRELVKMVLEAAKKNGEFSSCLLTREFGASDDATIFMDMVQRQGGQAAYLLFGTDIRGLHHEADFDFSEDVLGKAFGVFCETAKLM